MSAIVAASAIGGASLLLSSLLSSSSASSTNKLTLEENQKNRDWQEYMWNQYNEYNTPYNQVQRYREAGLNPALMYSSGTYDSSSTSYGTPSTNNQFQQTFSPSTMQGISSLVNAAINAASVEAEIKNKDVSTEKGKIDLQYLHKNWQLGLSNLDRQGALLDVMTKKELSQTELIQYQQDLTRAQTEKAWQEFSNLQIDANVKAEVIENMKLVNEWYPKYQASLIALQVSQGKNQLAQTNFYKAQSELLKAQKVFQDVQNKYGEETVVYKILESFGAAMKDIYEGGNQFTFLGIKNNNPSAFSTFNKLQPSYFKNYD